MKRARIRWGGQDHGHRIGIGDRVDRICGSPLVTKLLDADPPHKLQLPADMRFPREATLEFRVHRLEGGRAELQQLSRYVPRVLSGSLYWYALYPFHQWVFRGMLKGVAYIA